MLGKKEQKASAARRGMLAAPVADIAARLDWTRRIGSIMERTDDTSVHERAREVTRMLRAAEVTGHLRLTPHESLHLTSVEVNAKNEMRAVEGDAACITKLVLQLQLMILKGEPAHDPRQAAEDRERDAEIEAAKSRFASSEGMVKLKDQLARAKKLTPSCVQKVLRPLAVQLSPGFYEELLARAQSQRTVSKETLYNGVLTALACESLIAAASR